ncbi:MAG: hypothetical protein V5A14_05315 [Desulfohalobiaceae bacterium]
MDESLRSPFCRGENINSFGSIKHVKQEKSMNYITTFLFLLEKKMGARFQMKTSSCQKQEFVLYYFVVFTTFQPYTDNVYSIDCSSSGAHSEHKKARRDTRNSRQITSTNAPASAHNSSCTAHPWFRRCMPCAAEPRAMKRNDRALSNEIDNGPFPVPRDLARSQAQGISSRYLFHGTSY